MAAPYELGYCAKLDKISSLGADLFMWSLLDNRQYDDRDGLAAAQNISPEMWPIFGSIWPSSHVLANYMIDYPLTGQRILEVGCGLALTSLIVHRRGGNITASDSHPLVPTFLTRNLAQNAMTVLPYHQANWEQQCAGLGRFDLIIGSDVLYEQLPSQHLSRFLGEHLEGDGKILIVDPNRGHRARFSRTMEDSQFGCTSMRLGATLPTPNYRGRMLTYQR